MTKDQQKDMMQYYYKKQEEFKVISRFACHTMGTLPNPDVLCSINFARFALILMMCLDSIGVSQKLQSDQDDTYLDSKWADSASLKQSLTGTQNISWRPR